MNRKNFLKSLIAGSAVVTGVITSIKAKDHVDLSCDLSDGKSTTVTLALVGGSMFVPVYDVLPIDSPVGCLGYCDGRLWGKCRTAWIELDKSNPDLWSGGRNSKFVSDFELNNL